MVLKVERTISAGCATGLVAVCEARIGQSFFGASDTQEGRQTSYDFQIAV
jgi:hypothetical protein